MARIRGVTTIVPSTDTTWSVKPHNNKEAAVVGDLAQARKAELQHHSPMEKRTLVCHPWIQGAAERQTVSPITSRQSRNKRLRTRCPSPLPSNAATRGRLHSCVALLDLCPLSIPSSNPLYRATLAPQQQTRQQQQQYQLRLDKLERCLGSRFSSTTYDLKSANAIHVAYQ
jgi:hypothetical protein